MDNRIQEAIDARYSYNDAMYQGEMSNPEDTNPYSPGSALSFAWNQGRIYSYGERLAIDLSTH